MALSVKVGHFSKSTVAVTGGSPLTTTSVTGLGFQPKVILLFTTSNTFGTGNILRFSAGMITSATNQFSISVIDVNNNSPSNTGARITNLGFLMTTTVSGVNVRGTITMDADGFTLTYDTNNNASQLISYLCLGGADLTNANIVNWQMNTSSGDQSVTGMGFRPDAVMHLAVSSITTVNNNSVGEAHPIIGAMDSSGNQWVNGFCLEDAVATTATSRFQYTNACLGGITPAAVESMRASYVSMGADGFTINISNPPTVATRVFSLGLKGPGIKVGTFDKSTGAATATQDITHGSFNSKGVFLTSWNTTASSTPAVKARHAYGMSDFTEQRTMALSDQNGVGTSNTDSNGGSNKALAKMDNNTATIEALADISSITNGFRASWTTNDAVASQIAYLSFGDTPVVSNRNQNLTTLGVG